MGGTRPADQMSLSSTSSRPVQSRPGGVHLPLWLQNFHDKALPTKRAEQLASQIKATVPSVRVALLGFGLVRSDPMLVRTVASVQEHLVAVLEPHHDVFVHAYCEQPLCSTTRTDEAIGRLERVRSLVVTTRFDKSLLLTSPACGPLNDSQAQCQRNYIAASMSLRQAYEPAARGGYGAYVAWRLDTLLLSPPVHDFWHNTPWRQPGTLYVPALQSGGAVNDRFIYASAAAMKLYVTQREALLSDRRKCIFAEELTLAVIKRLGLTAALSRVRVVRLRWHLRAPDVDNASMGLGASARNWMVHIHRFSSKLICHDWNERLGNETVAGLACRDRDAARIAAAPGTADGASSSTARRGHGRTSTPSSMRAGGAATTRTLAGGSTSWWQELLGRARTLVYERFRAH